MGQLRTLEKPLLKPLLGSGGSVAVNESLEARGPVLVLLPYGKPRMVSIKA